MLLDEPSWWYPAPDQPAPGFISLLRPLGRLAHWVALQRWQRGAGYRASLPVICVGNFTAGGTGKTPASIALARQLNERSERPVFLTRGYGGRIKMPTRVDLDRDAAALTGDEALLLARIAPTIVSPDRAAGARFIETEIAANRLDATVIIMDDGLQNPSLAKDLVIAIVDGTRAFGNGYVIPAGPLRASLDFQLTLTDAIIVNLSPGAEQASEIVPCLKQRFQGPVLEAAPVPVSDIAWMKETPIVAYAGIGNPARFFSLLETHGAVLADRIIFPDHHVVNQTEARRVLDSAKHYGAAIVTTEKDFVRSARTINDAQALHEASRVIAIRLDMSTTDQKHLNALLDSVLHSHKLKARRSKT